MSDMTLLDELYDPSQDAVARATGMTANGPKRPSPIDTVELKKRIADNRESAVSLGQGNDYRDRAVVQALMHRAMDQSDTLAKARSGQIPASAPANANEPGAQDNDDIARQFGLSPATGPVPPTHPQAMNIPATKAEMAAWLKRGGQLPPNTPGGVRLPNGNSVGGEFSDAEMRAYQDAQQKLESAEAMQKLVPMLRALHSRPAAPDATRTR